MIDPKPAQTEQILAHLLRGESITAVEAQARYGCFRLAARIGELRKQGHAIQAHLDRRTGHATYALALPAPAKEGTPPPGRARPKERQPSLFG
jgi:hypothetical protein